MTAHDASPTHPERPDRLRAVLQAARNAGFIASATPFAAFELPLGITPIAPWAWREITSPLASLADIELVHDASYIDRVRRGCERSAVLDQSDTPTCPESFDAALRSCGGVIEATRAVLSGEVQRAFAAGRPPGHHAEPQRPMGFCLFSNIAIAARVAQRDLGLERIAIVDFDVHHGNGTQAAFEADPSVLFISIHQDPRTLYPGSGYSHEAGIGAGEGFTLNVPMPPGAGDAEYDVAMRETILPKLDAFAPQLIMLSAGFDGHARDAISNIELSTAGFYAITRQLVELANAHCNGRIVSALEGGYHLVSLGQSVAQHLLALSQD